MERVEYNHIIAAFKKFCDEHYQIAQFVDVKEADFQAVENVYPSVVCVPMPSQISAGRVVLQFALVFCDILIADNSNARDIYNDQLEIVKDFVAYFTNNPELDWSLDEELTIEPFIERMDDSLCGWVLQASVTVPFDRGVCDIPIDINVGN